MIMYYTALPNIKTRMLPSLAGFLLSGTVSANIIPSHGYTVIFDGIYHLLHVYITYEKYTKIFMLNCVRLLLDALLA